MSQTTVLTALTNAIVTALNNAGITTPAQVGIGHPNFEDLTKIITAGQYQVTLFSDPGPKDATQFFPQWTQQTAPNVTLTATIAGNVVTFAGTVPASGPQFNIHTLVGSPLKDAYVQTMPGDTPASIATKVAAAVNAIPGLSASATGAAVTVIGSSALKCNVGGSGTFAREVLRLEQLIEVTAWCPDDVLRASVQHAIISSIGNVGNRRLPIGDGTNVVLWYKGHVWDDAHEQDYSMYRSIIRYMASYPVLQTQTATQIGAFAVTQDIDGTTLPPVYEG